MLKAEYELHDKVYQKLKNNNEKSWSAQSDLDQLISDFYEILGNENINTFRLVELGCGTALELIHLLEHTNTIQEAYGVDISETALELARNNSAGKNLNLSFLKASVLDLSQLYDQPFDIAWDGRCLHCIIADDRKTFLNEVRKVLKPNSFFIVNSMCSVIDKELRNYDPKTKYMLMSNGTPVRYIPGPQEILDELTNAGFSIQKFLVRCQLNENEFDDLVVLAKR